MPLDTVYTRITVIGDAKQRNFMFALYRYLKLIATFFHVTFFV